MGERPPYKRDVVGSTPTGSNMIKVFVNNLRLNRYSLSTSCGKVFSYNASESTAGDYVNFVLTGSVCGYRSNLSTSESKRRF